MLAFFGKKISDIETKKYIYSFLRNFKNKALQNVAIFTFGTMVAQALSFLTLPIFTRYLNANDYGIYNYTSTVMSFLLALSALSLNSFVLRHYFEIKSNADKKKLFGTIFIFILLLNIMLLIIEFWIIAYLINQLHIKVPFDPYFKIALISNFFEVMGILPLIYFRITKKAWQFLVISATKAILATLTGLVLVIIYKIGIMGLFYGNLSINLLFVPIYLLVIIRISSFSFDFKLLKKGLKYSLPIVPSAFVTMAMLSLDRLILERYVNLSSLGIYSIGVALGSALLILVRGFYYAIEPVIYEAFNKDNFNQKIMGIKNKFLFLILFLGCVLIIFCKDIMAIMASEQFFEAYKIIPIYVISCNFSAVQVLITTTIFALNKTSLQPIIIGIALIINFIGNIILIPVLGIMGAAIASVIAFWCLYIMSAYITNKYAGIKWGVFKDTVIILLFCGLSALIMNIQISTLLYMIMVKLGGIIAIGFFIKILINRSIILPQRSENTN